MFGSRAFFFKLAACLPLFAAAAALAQPYPAKPITVIVPFAAGGGVDATARLVMPKLAEQLKQSIVIENLGGRSREGVDAPLLGWPSASGGRRDRRPQLTSPDRHKSSSQRCW